MHHNIQHLFKMISVANIRRYLADRGWSPRPSEGADRIYFDRTFAGGEQTSTLWTWASAEHAKFRNQVPNIIFTLSVLEGRPALDIANEIHASSEDPEPIENGDSARSAGAAESTAFADSGSTPTQQRVVLRLPQHTVITVTQDMLTDVVQVPAGDLVEFVHRGGPTGPLDLEIAADSIKAVMPQQAGLRLLQGVARPRVGPNWSATQIVSEQSRRLEDAGDSKGAAQLLEQLAPVLARIDFELDVNARIDAAQQALLQRQAAVLAAACARRLAPNETSKQLIWRTCAALLFPVGLRLDLRSTSADELFDIAAADDEVSPKQTLLWLKENTASVIA